MPLPDPDARAALLSGYAVPTGTFDELVDGDGNVRSHWSRLLGSVLPEGAGSLQSLPDALQRIIDSDGVTYRGPGGSRDGRAWHVDPIPLTIDAATWSTLERGVAERAEVLDAVLDDLLGAQRFLASVLVPPEVVFGHGGFLRPAHGLPRPGPRRLVTYATDLIRTRDGGFVVVGDRTQAPSGAGYALENRSALSRLLPAAHREANVQRLAPFFRSLRSALRAAAPAGVEDPRIVVLSPGPWSETAFEHAYLASYLGYSLVQGGDLVARHGRIWMRSLGHLEPVDVILRRVDDISSDPLELDPASELGVPGLLEVARLGNVSIVNPVGAGVLENPALWVFLPNIAEVVLGRSLQLATPTTWWCGDAASRSHVLANLDRLVVKPIDRRFGTAVLPGTSTAVQREALRRDIEARPHRWVGQEEVHPGVAPAVGSFGLEPRGVVIRAFAAPAGETYTVMPGALARMAPEPGSNWSLQAGSWSKDTWVLASSTEDESGYWLRRGPIVHAVDPAGTMPSRAAENLFWIGRYAERAEDLVRLLRVVSGRRNEFDGASNPAGGACVGLLGAALREVVGVDPAGGLDDGLDPSAVTESGLRGLLADRELLGSVAHSVSRLLDAAHAVRDQLSGDTWLVLSTIERALHEAAASGDAGRRSTDQVLSECLQGLLALAGIAAESMIRDPGWELMDAGRRIERSIHTVDVLRATLVDEHDAATDSLLLESVLTTCESIITYRRRYRSQAQVETVLDLLVLDAANTRSVLYQLEHLAQAVASIPRAATGPSAEEELVRDALASVHLLDTAELARVDPNGSRPRLRDALDEVGAALRGISDSIERTHFVHLKPQRSLAVRAEDSAR